MIRERYATSHHFELGPERHNVPVSPWAFPKGMPEDAVKNRPAVRGSDHDLSHLGFVDSTPVWGVPGATTKSIRASGAYGFGEAGVSRRVPL